MRHFTILTAVLGLVALSSVSSWAQRGIGAENVVVDDGAGHTITIQDPPGLTGNYTWTLPISPTGVSSAYVSPGTTNNSTLRWDAGTTSWLENTNVLATSAGALSATSIDNTPVGATTPSTVGFTALTGATAIESGDYAVGATDFCVLESGSGSTVTLPATATKGRIISVKFTGGSGNSCTLSGNGNTIDGSANQTLYSPANSGVSGVILVGDGTNWWITGQCDNPPQIAF